MIRFVLLLLTTSSLLAPARAQMPSRTLPDGVASQTQTGAQQMRASPPPAADAPDGQTPAQQAPPADDKSHQAASDSTMRMLTPDNAMAILGGEVHTPDRTEIGRIVDVLVDRSGQPQAVVLDSGGFLGVGNRKVAINWTSLHFSPAHADDAITTSLQPDQIRSAAAYIEGKPALVIMEPPPQVWLGLAGDGLEFAGWACLLNPGMDLPPVQPLHGFDTPDGFPVPPDPLMPPPAFVRTPSERAR